MADATYVALCDLRVVTIIPLCDDPGVVQTTKRSTRLLLTQLDVLRPKLRVSLMGGKFGVWLRNTPRYPCSDATGRSARRIGPYAITRCALQAGESSPGLVCTYLVRRPAVHSLSSGCQPGLTDTGRALI